MRAKPLIAVPTYHLPGGQIGRWGSGGYAIPTPYVDGLTRAGAVAVLLPSRADVDAAAALEPFDGLLLPGGGDIDPARYGQEPHPNVYGMDDGRDAFELAAFAEARRRALPVLAICRGMQMVNIACGGDLVQHVPDHPDYGAHGAPGGGKSALHDVQIDAGSRLAEAVGAASVSSCTSWHHQAVGKIGEGLRAVGWTTDGLVEAIEPTDADGPWLVAVQWHPETTAANDPVQQRLFAALVRACLREAAVS